jgi:thymidylate synthase
MITIEAVREYFKSELANGNFTEDRNGGKTIEMLGASFIADQPAIFGKPNKEYIDAEIAWYESKSTNITDIYPEGDKEPPKAWQMTANVHGEVNSNYGHLIWSDKYFNQRINVCDELLNNPDSRRASMIYTRPSIWKEYNESGKNDFICTNSVTYYIRDQELHCVVQMRSNDVVFGYKNDYAWQKFLLVDLCKSLQSLEPSLRGLMVGTIHWQVQNLHVYDRHFDLVK